MNCPKCNSEMDCSLEFTGGCDGHGPDEYCYCDSLDVHVLFICKNNRKIVLQEIKEGKRYVKNKNFCNGEFKPQELSDYHSIERWLEKNV